MGETLGLIPGAPDPEAVWRQLPQLVESRRCRYATPGTTCNHPGAEEGTLGCVAFLLGRIAATVEPLAHPLIEGTDPQLDPEMEAMARVFGAESFGE